MKNIIVISLSIFFSILIGMLFMQMNTKGAVVEEERPIQNTLKAFQVGSFLDETVASLEAKTKNGKVIFDGTHYCVYLAILRDPENIERMSNYLNNNKIYYYIKTLDQVIPDESDLYESMMRQTKSDVAFIKLAKKAIDLYEGS